MNYDWEQTEDAYRFSDRDEPDREPVIHARADVDGRAFPCGVDARAMVEVGSDSDVTCDGCNMEMQRRSNLQRVVFRTTAALLYSLGHIGRSQLPVVRALRDALVSGSLTAIGKASTDIYALAFDLFWLHGQQEQADAFLRAVDALGLRRTGGSLQDAFAAIERLEEPGVPF